MKDDVKGIIGNEHVQLLVRQVKIETVRVAVTNQSILIIQIM